MCLTIVGKILEVNGKKGVAEVDGERREVNLGLVDVKIGDYVSCSLDLAIEKLETDDAIDILNARKGLVETRG